MGRGEGGREREGGEEGRRGAKETRWRLKGLRRLLRLLVLFPSHLAVLLGVKSFHIRDFDLNHAPEPPEEMTDLHPFEAFNNHLLDGLVL